MLHAIQALRLLSALWVMLYHTRDNPLLAPASGPWQTFIGFGYLGVDIFFVISGFIMALNTANAPAGKRQALRFLITRCARIYSGWWPVFLLCLLVYGGADQLQGKDLPGSFWLYQLNFNILVLPVTWTLTYELYFYAVVALSLLAPGHWRTRIFWACLAILLATNAWWIATGRYEVEQFGRSHYGMHLFLSPLCLEFLLGYLLQRQQQRLRLPAPLLALLTLSAAAALYGYATHMAHKPSGLSGFFHFPERAVLAGLFAACLLGLFLALESWLPRRISLWGGDISYMVYLLHLPVLWLFQRFVAPLLPASAPLGVTVVLALVLALSTVVHLAAERPAYRWFKRLAAP